MAQGQAREPVPYPEARDPVPAGSLRARIGPHLNQAIRALRATATTVHMLLVIAGSVITVAALTGAAIGWASGRMRPWLVLLILAVWLWCVWYAVWRAGRFKWALRDTGKFTQQFFEALDLTGAAAKAGELFGQVRPDPAADGGGVADGGDRVAGGGAGSSPGGRRAKVRGWARLLLQFYAIAKVPGNALERVKALPLVAVFVPSSLAWTRNWLILAAAATVICPVLAITLLVIGS